MSNKKIYTYELKGKEENRIEARLQIDANHPLYFGHFPGFPVTPGVCQVQMIREILESEVGHPLMLMTAKQIKFTAIHEPGMEPVIDASVSFEKSGNHIRASAQLHCNEKIYLKFKGEFRKQI